MKEKQTYEELENQIVELKRQNEILKLSKDSLLVKEEKFFEMFEQAPLAYQSLDSEGCFLMVNETWLKTFGYNRDEVIGRWFGDFFAPEYVEAYRKRFSQFKTQERVHFEFEMMHKNGESRFVSLVGEISKTQKGEFIRTHCILQDITKRNHAEESMRKLNMAIRQSQEVIFITDKDGVFTFVNPGFTKMYGYTAEEVIGKTTPRILKCGLYPKEHYTQLWDTLLSKQSIPSAEYINKDSSGKLIDMEGSADPILNKKGDIIGFLGIQRDITERKQTEGALKESEGKLKTLNNISSEMLLLEDLGSIYNFIVKSLQKRFSDTIVLFVSIDKQNKKARLETHAGLENKLLKKAIQLAGFNPVGKEYNLISSNEDYLKAGGLVEYDGGLVEFSGSEFPSFAARAIEKLVRLNKIYTVGITKDDNLLAAIHLFTFNKKVITEHSFIESFVRQAAVVLQKKIAETALQESEANLKAITENSIESIWSIDRNYNIQYVNKVFAKAFETSFGVALSKGDSIMEALPGQIRPMWKERYDRAFNNEQFIFSDKIGVGDSAIYIEVAMNPILVDGKVVGASFYGKDISARKNNEIQLIAAKENAEESETRFKALHDASFGGILIHDKGIIIDCNQGLSDMTGYSVNELIGMNGMLLVTKQSRDLVKQNMLTGYEKPCEMVGLHKNGIEFPLLVEARNIPYKGKLVRAVEFRDISEQKKAELEIIKAKEKAEESDRLKSAFLANMSHEIRTPMNGILGFSELLKEPELTDTERQEYISIIEKSGARLLNIINDIVCIAKIESGQMEVNMQESNINEQIEYIYKFFKPEIEGKGIQFTFTNPIPSEEASLITDADKVYAILINLVKNAIKFTKKGSIEFGYSLKGNFLEFQIKDTGIGIPRNRQKAIFERFIQADVADKMARQGAGLGLAISKAYIEMLGGKIWVKSEEDVGSAFHFTLPYQTKITKEDSAKIEAISSTEISPARNNKILIVEDNKLSEKLISITVQKLGSKIMIARTGTEAVSICRSNPDIDLVLMDIQLPEMDGYEATRQIRKFNKELIIIAQTAYALAGDKEKALAAGCNDYISKPIKADLLKQKISKHLKNNKF